MAIIDVFESIKIEPQHRHPAAGAHLPSKLLIEAISKVRARERSGQLIESSL